MWVCTHLQCCNFKHINMYVTCIRNILFILNILIIDPHDPAQIYGKRLVWVKIFVTANKSHKKTKVHNMLVCLSIHLDFKVNTVDDKTTPPQCSVINSCFWSFWSYHMIHYFYYSKHLQEFLSKLAWKLFICDAETAVSTKTILPISSS